MLEYQPFFCGFSAAIPIVNLLIKGWLGHGIGGKESLPLEVPDSG